MTSSRRKKPAARKGKLTEEMVRRIESALEERGSQGDRRGPEDSTQSTERRKRGDRRRRPD